tara:strand:+ start:1226 stop:1687 length:462 start_codon:yes stop_codon:yes gene_type:complete
MDSSGADVRFPSPIIYAVFCAIGLALDSFQMVTTLDWSFAPIAGWALMVVTVLLMVVCVVYMHRAQTTVRPDRPSNAIMSDGPFALSRNPIYVAWLILYVGIALAWGDAWTLLMAVPCAVVIHRYAVLREERYLTDRFGAAYTDYQARVRRYL